MVHRLFNMKEKDWQYFKQRNIKHIWQSMSDGYGVMRPLCQNKLVDFIEKYNLQKYFYIYCALRFFLSRKPAIPNTLQYMVTTHCNMACEECNTKIPYFSEKSHIQNPDFITFKNDIDKLLGSVNYIYCLGFVGGEPLLNRDIAKMVEYACRQRKIGHVFIATNCTISPPPELIDAMRHRKFAIQCSDYSMVKSVKSRYAEWKKILGQNNIKASYPHDHWQPENPIFLKMPELFPDRQDCDKMKRIFENCFGQYCNMLVDGVLLQCTIAVYIWRNLQRTPELCAEAVNIRELPKKELSKKIVEFYSRSFSEACHYCHWTKKFEFTPRAKQIYKIER